MLCSLVALAAIGVWRAIALAWVCDDSFISFRYAGNLIEGFGLVYNQGERVEGYSNLLWTLLMALWMRLGVDPIRAAQAMGIASYLLLVLLLAAWSFRRARRPGGDGDATPALPLAAAVTLIANDFHVWATGGLETMMFALAGVAAILATRLDPSARRDWTVGALLAILVLSRPDGVLYAPAALASLWFGDGPRPTSERARTIARAAVPLAIVVALLAAWKLTYYGELFPTAFYSKSAASPYYVQGLRYVGLYLAKSWYLLPALLLVPWLAARSPGRDRERTDRFVFVGTAALLLAYVLHSGGDFMFARRLVPIAPFLLLALESWIAAFERPSRRAIAAIAIAAAAALPYPVFGPGRWRIEGIADEPHFYPKEAIATRRAQGELLGTILRDTPVRAMFEGGMCMVGYYSGLPYLVEMTGLTQYSLARLPIAERGTIGHEKQPDDRWLDDNEIHLIVEQEWPMSPPPPGARPHDEVVFGNLVKARIWLYSDAVMDGLRGRPDVSFVPIEQVVARLRAEMDTLPYERARAIYDYLDHYYLRTSSPRAIATAVELQKLLDAKQRQETGS